MKSVAFEKLDLFHYLQDKNILVRNASRKNMNAKGKVTIKFEINGKSYIHTFFICDKMKRQIMIGHNLLIKKRMSIGCDDDENGKPIKILKDQIRILTKPPEQKKGNMLWLKRAITVPP